LPANSSSPSSPVLVCKCFRLTEPTMKLFSTILLIASLIVVTLASTIADLHIHLDEHNCLEVIVIRGRGDKVHEIAGKLIATKGVQNGKLVTTTPEMKH